MAEETFEHTNNLENLLSPFCYEPETPLPKTSPEVPGGIYLSGFISQDCTWGCSFNHSVIQCFPVNRYFEDQSSGFGTNSNSGSSVAVSSSSYTFTGGRITCAAELAIHNQRTSSGARKLLLGISFIDDSNPNRDFLGALVLFDPIRCAPMKWIELPEPVSSVSVVSHFEEGGSNRPFFNETMMTMVGIAAVGLRGGAVIIVDLGLDDPDLSSACSSDSRNVSNLPYRLVYVNPHEYVIATKRHKAVSNRNLIALKFTNEPEDEIVSDAFHYCRPNGETVLILQKNSVAVTCIEYVPAIGSLLVGFTCGGFQIWRVNNMELQFSSDPVQRERNIPVFGFGFQQPVDDPRNFCYVWVMYGNNSAECAHSFMELHSLLYERKSYVENFGHIYDGYKQSSKRMEVPLIDHFLLNESDAEDSSVRTSARPVRIWTQPDSNLMFCTWEVSRGGLFYFGAFDLNQWYSNHTKEYINYNPLTGLCPFWVALPIEIADVSNILLDVRMIPKSLIHWENPHNKQDVHLYPASLSFQAVCLTNTGVSAFEHFGIQEKLIRIMVKDGANLMVQPAGLKNSFIRYGLEPVFQLVYSDHLSQKDRDRYFILSVLLETRRTSIIIRLANSWLDGSYANVGCTIDLIIDWIGSYMLAVRESAYEHWGNLLNFPDDSLPPETIRFINFSNFAWTLLHKMLLTLMNPSEVYSARGMDLEDIEFGLSKLVQYSSALLMLYKAKLLPESDPAFLRNLTDYYEQRRAEAKNALESSKYIDEPYKKSHPLMIDHLMDCLLLDEDLYEEWHVEDGQPLYPPQHIGYLANMFMWTDADPKAVARVFIYFLIDLNSFFAHNTSGVSNGDVERKIRGNFKAVMDAAFDEYQDIMNLWLLDHGLHDEILVHLKGRDRLYDNDGLPWCAATVALTAAGYEMDMAEILLKSCPSSLAKLLFSLMTSSPSKYNSLAELMVTNSFSADTELLQQFFEVSDNRDCLGEFIQRKVKQLSSDVREELLVFLNNSDSFRRLSQLLMYFIHLQDYQKLEEEFTRVRNILRAKELPENERRVWKFQEYYIVHLLNTTRTKSVVENFLQFQLPPPSRQMKCTISVPAVEAQPEEMSPVPSSSRSFRSDHKLPPQLRRLKLCETIASDPLSPLKRYVGRMQGSTEPTESDDERQEQLKNRRLSIKNSRTSLCRSFSMRRKTISSTANQPAANLNDSEANDERPYDNRRNTSISIDLISILKPPAIDHRLEKSRGMSFLSNTTLGGMPGLDETLNQYQPVHSIMKEKDSSKPKVMKKVELRFENMSLHSSDDDKDATIYEDADENPLDDSEVEIDLANTGFEASFTSVSDTGEDNLPQSDEQQSLQQTSNVSDVQEIENVASQPPPETETEPEDTDPTKIGETYYENPDEVMEEDDTPSPSYSPVKLSSPGKETPEEKGSEKEIFTPPKAPLSKSPSHSPVKEKHSPLSESQEKRAEPTHQPVSPKTMEDIEIVTTEASPGVRTRSSKSRTPVRDIPSTPIISEEEETPTRKTPTPPPRSTRRSSRSRTPSREVSEEQSNEEVQGRMSQRVTRSRTPTRDVSVVKEVEETQEQHLPVGRKSRSTTPTRVTEVVAETKEDEPEPKRMRRTRAGSMTKEVVQENVSEEMGDSSSSVSAPSRRRSRVSRSRTPTRDIPILPDIPEETELNVTAKKSKKGSSRSTTPTRELKAPVPDDSPSEKSDISGKPVRRSARTQRSIIDLYEDYDEEESIQIAVRRSLRSSRSRTPTRDLGTGEAEHQENIEEQSTENLRRKTRRSTRSVTPTRDREIGEQEKLETIEEEKKPRKPRSTRSTTPSRDSVLSENVDESEDKGESEDSRRSSRVSRSRTPTRDKADETSPKKPGRKGTRSAKAAVEEIPAQENVEDMEVSEEALDTTLKARKRRAKRKSEEPQAGTSAQSQESFTFETSTAADDDHTQGEEKPTTSKAKSKSLEKPVRKPKRRLKYFDHHQDLSTLIEDSLLTATFTDASVMEATLLAAPVAEPEPVVKPKGKRIKGIKQRPVLGEEESAASTSAEAEGSSTKPTKRRKKAAVIVEDLEDDLLSEGESHVSLRSNRSSASRRSTASGKGKRGRRGKSVT